MAIICVTKSRITRVITILQESINETDAQVQMLPLYLGYAPEAALRTYSETFVREITEFLYTSAGDVEAETMSGLLELEADKEQG